MRYWRADNASTLGAALAFYCAFSLAPLLVILLTITGWVVGATAAFAQISAQLSALFGLSTAKILLDAVKNSQQAQGLVATLVGVVTLLIGATTVLAALESALEQILKSAALVPAGFRGWMPTLQAMRRARFQSGTLTSVFRAGCCLTKTALEGCQHRRNMIIQCGTRQ